MKIFRITPAAIVILSGIVAALHIGKIPPAIPLLRDSLGLSLIEAGFLLSMVQLAGMIGGVFIGLATDSLGLRRSMVSGQLILSVASFAGMWVQNPAYLLLLRALEGLGFLLTVLPAPSLIRQLVPVNQLALHLGLWGIYMATGTSVALLCGPTIMNVIDWQGWWGLLAGVSAAMAFLVQRRVPSEQEQKNTPTGHLPAATSDSWWHRLRLTLTSAGPWRIAITFSMYSSQWLAVIGFLPSIYAQAGVTGQIAGTLTALASLVNVIGNIAAGRLLHRGVCARNLLYIGFACMALTTFFAFTQMTDEFPVLRYLAILIFSAAGGLIPGTLFSLAVHEAPNEQTISTTVGWIQQCSSTGQFLGPPLVAWLAGEVGGWYWTWTITGTASIIGLLLSRGVNFKRHSLPSHH